MRELLTDLDSDPALSDPDPVKRAQLLMRTPLPKRFYKAVDIAVLDGSHAVRLDGRAAKTPGRATIALPTAAAAQLVADEFAEQVDVINPVSMPVLRLANTAIDGVAREPDAVAEDILRFSSSDLLCYRAEGPEGLVARQSAAWDPVLDWVVTALGARFTIAEGVMHVAQPPAAIQAVKFHLASGSEPFRLAAMHLLTSISGSALLALAVEAGALSAEDAWKAAHVDEDWQIDHWGQDSEAIARRNARWRDFNAAARLIAALD